MDKIQDRHPDKWTKYKTDTLANGKIAIHSHRQMDKIQDRHTHKWTKYKTDTQINVQIARQTHK